MTQFYHAVQQPIVQLSLFDFSDPDTSTKVCKTCGIEKPLRVFAFHTRDTGGRRSDCNQCRAKKNRERQLHPGVKPTPQKPALPDCKVCKTCGREKVLSDFSPQPECRFGRANHCRECVNAKKRARTIEKHALDPIPRPGHKFCSKCGIERLYPQEFNKRENKCKVCKSTEDKIRQSKPEYQEHDKIRHRKNQKYYAAHYMKTKEAYRERGRAWRKANPDKQREHNLRRKASKLNTVVDPVDYKAILERDGYHCYLCGKPIDPTVKSRTTAALTFDHKVPLQPRPGEPQGTHTADNIFPAHHACNTRKQNIPFELLTPWQRRGV